MPTPPPSTTIPPFDAGVTAPVYLTRDIPGINGSIKNRPEDFLVQELPLYQPTGHGEHIYMYIEKRGLSTMQMCEIVARHFKVNRRSIGHAGLKDKHAITQQVISVHTPGKTPEDFPSLQHEKLTVQWVDLHTNKLKRGHLAGNRFSIRVRDVDPTGVIHANRSLQQLSKQGVPNRFGPQRFGLIQNNHEVGRAIILDQPQLAADLLCSPHELAPTNQHKARELYAQGNFEAARDSMPKIFKIERRILNLLAKGSTVEQAVHSIDQTAAGFFVSAFQSAIFNAVLNDRVSENTHDRLVSGDVGFVLKSRQLFEIGPQTADEPETVQRLATGEICPSGPMWGTSMMRASGEIDTNELQALAKTGVSIKDLESCESRDRLQMIGGDRRPLRIPVIDPEVEGGVDDHGAYIRCAFELPRGSFATTVMDEIMKVPPGFNAGSSTGSTTTGYTQEIEHD
ncbi:MAG: tRNA pseudouridine(13) synthase TruD [Phycisphaerales bacterium]